MSTPVGIMGEIVFEPRSAFDRSVEANQRTQSGLWVTSFSALYGDLHSWFKLKGEGAQILYCTPSEFREVWREYKRLNDPDAIIAACDFNYGLPNYYFWEVVSEFVHVSNTHKPKESAKPAPGSIWMPDWEGPKSGIWIER